MLRLCCRVSRDEIFCQVTLRFCRRALSVKAHPGLWAVANSLQLPFYFFFFFLISAEFILRITWVRFQSILQLAEEKVIEIFERLSPVLLSI